MLLPLRKVVLLSERILLARVVRTMLVLSKLFTREVVVVVVVGCE
jgi:hypothetical protein